jgi:hypothetical protein
VRAPCARTIRTCRRDEDPGVALTKPVSRVTILPPLCEAYDYFVADVAAEKDAIAFARLRAGETAARYAAST